MDRQPLPNKRCGNGGPKKRQLSATAVEWYRSRNKFDLRLPVSDVSTLLPSEESLRAPETMRRTRRLEALQNQLQRANRRAAGPFSHPFAIRGTLAKLSEQIRDVSRVTDAVMLNAEIASDQRVNEICSDIKSLLQTQQRWTDRLENQIWRLESQTSLMRRLQKLLQDRSPGNDRMWELCETIARETQALPTGMLLLPEPGHRVLLSNDPLTSRVSWSIEQARLAVFAAVTVLPDVRGADIVARTLHAASSHLLEFAGRDLDTSVFSESQWMQRDVIANHHQKQSRLIEQAGHVLSATDSLSMTVLEMIVPPAIEDFYGGLLATIAASALNEEDLTMAHAICNALGLSAANTTSRHDKIDLVAGDAVAVDDAAIVLTHKLRWHDGAQSHAAKPAGESHSRIRRPHFAAAGGAGAALTVFARED